MRKAGLVVLSMFCFALVSSTDIDYSKMSATSLNEALVEAVRKGSSGEVQTLVQAGADGNQNITYREHQYDDYDYIDTTTLLKYAAKEGFVDIVKVLKVKATNDDINEALILAAEKGRLEVVRELIQAKPKMSAINTALISSAKKGNPSVLRELIKAGANVNHTDEYGSTALIGLMAYNSDRETETWKKSRAQAVQDLLKAKANVNHTDKQGNTALMRSIQNFDLDAVQVLLKAPGININCANKDGSTPIILACLYVQTSYVPDYYGRARKKCEDSQEILKILLETPGINLHHANKNGTTAIKLIEDMTSRF